MQTLRQFVDVHFFSRKANLLYDFFEAQSLVHVLQLVINQISKESLPDPVVTAEGIYVPIKQGLKNIINKRDYEQIEELVREFGLRVMIEYFKLSTLPVEVFINKMSEGMQGGAKSVGVDPLTIDGDMEWDRIRLNLINLRTPGLESTLIPVFADLGDSVKHFIWNQEADLDYLKKVLVNEFSVFERGEIVDMLFEKSHEKVCCQQSKIEFLVSLFRELCPLKPNPLMPDGRIVSESSPREFWQILATRIIKPNGSHWSIGTLKNYCSKWRKKEEYRDRREEIKTIIQRLESEMRFM